MVIGAMLAQIRIELGNLEAVRQSVAVPQSPYLHKLRRNDTPQSTDTLPRD